LILQSDLQRFVAQRSAPRGATRHRRR
jgi:hypothetical protein